MIQLHQNQKTNLSPFLVYTMTVPNIDYHYTLNTIYTELLYMTFLPSSLPAMYDVYELESIHISPHSTFFPMAAPARTFLFSTYRRSCSSNVRASS